MGNEMGNNNSSGLQGEENLTTETKGSSLQETVRANGTADNEGANHNVNIEAKEKDYCKELNGLVSDVLKVAGDHTKGLVDDQKSGGREGEAEKLNSRTVHPTGTQEGEKKGNHIVDVVAMKEDHHEKETKLTSDVPKEATEGKEAAEVHDPAESPKIEVKSDNAAGESEVKSGLKSKQIENHEGANASYSEKNPLETSDRHIDQSLISVKKDNEIGESQVKASFKSKDEENNEEAKAFNSKENLLEICDRRIDQRETSIEKEADYQNLNTQAVRDQNITPERKDGNDIDNATAEKDQLEKEAKPASEESTEVRDLHDVVTQKSDDEKEIEKTEVHPPAESPKAEVKSDNDAGGDEVQPSSELGNTDNYVDPKLPIPEENPSEIRDHWPENQIYVEKVITEQEGMKSLVSDTSSLQDQNRPQETTYPKLEQLELVEDSEEHGQQTDINVSKDTRASISSDPKPEADMKEDHEYVKGVAATKEEGSGENTSLEIEAGADKELEKEMTKTLDHQNGEVLECNGDQPPTATNPDNEDNSTVLTRERLEKSIPGRDIYNEITNNTNSAEKTIALTEEYFKVPEAGVLQTESACGNSEKENADSTNKVKEPNGENLQMELLVPGNRNNMQNDTVLVPEPGTDCKREDTSSHESGGDYQGQENSERLSIESSSNIGTNGQAQMQKSPSFDLDLKIEAKDEECSDRTTSAHQELSSTEEKYRPEHQEMAAEERVVRMEKSDSEKSKTPFLGFLKEEEEANIVINNQQKQEKDIAGKDLASSSPKSRVKRKHRSSLFTNCMCCTTVIH